MDPISVELHFCSEMAENQTHLMPQNMAYVQGEINNPYWGRIATITGEDSADLMIKYRPQNFTVSCTTHELAGRKVVQYEPAYIDPDEELSSLMAAIRVCNDTKSLEIVFVQNIPMNGKKITVSTFMNIKCRVLLTGPYGVDEMMAQQAWGDYRLTEEDLHYLLQPLVNLKQLYIYRIHTSEFSAHWIDCIKLAGKCNRQLEDLEVVTENANSFMPPHSNTWIQNLRSLKQLQRLALSPGNDNIMDSYFRGMTESTPHKHRIVDQILDASILG